MSHMRLTSSSVPLTAMIKMGIAMYRLHRTTTLVSRIITPVIRISSRIMVADMHNKHHEGAICLTESVVVMVAAAGQEVVEEAVAEVVVVDSTEAKRTIDVVGGWNSFE